jgi:4-amino-4-deoxy-L-arabinose transferase-like glycosyltransferase
LWVAVYDFTPPNKRPYAGTTNTNSVLELVVGPYGIGRFVQPTRLSTMDTAQFGLGPTKTTGVVSDSGRRAEPRRRREMPRMLVRARAGPLRLLDGQLAGQVGWLFPLALAGVVLTALHEPRLKPFNPVHLAVMLWSGWALTYAAVYSAAGGIFHFHYMAMLAPPLAALAGIGTVSLWRLSVAGAWRAVLLPATLLLTAAWQLYVEASALAGYDGWQTRLHCVLLGGALLGAGGLVVFAISRARSWLARVSAACALGIGLAALLVVPIAWALSSVLRVPHNVLPSADLARLLTEDGSVDAESRGTEVYANLSQLIAFLTANRQGERYLLATSSTMLAAPIIIQTGQAVMARGGFNGVDPILTPEKLADMVRAKQVRFVMLGDLWTASRRLGAETAQQPIAEWVRANGKLVDPTLWRADTSLGSAMQLYDLRPGTTPLIAAHSDG